VTLTGFGVNGGRPLERVPVVRVHDGQPVRRSDAVAGEEPLELRIDGEPLAVTMRTPVPGEDAELALGFVLAEALLSMADIARVVECRAPHGDGGIADVRLRAGARPAPGWQRRFHATSACGICGKESIDAVRVCAPALGSGPSVDWSVLASLPERLRARQRNFERTGGLHAAGAFTAGGELVAVREDVGRHNAVDKLIGRAAMDTMPLGDHVLMVSGRLSFEIVQKALLAGIAVLAAVSAPSSLAVRLARESDMTLVGFVRDGGFNVYSAAQRVAGTA
jgi:FdhD protein